jgi:PAS domain S-box-containing protein
MPGGDPRASRPEDELLRSLADRIPAMVAYWDASLRCRFANQAYKRWFGVRPESLIGRHISELLGPLYALNLPYIEGALRGEPQKFEREIPDPSGGPSRHSLADYIPDIVDGGVRGFFVLVTDISEVKRVQLALEESEARFSETIDAAPIGMAIVGLEGRFVRVNRALCEIVGYTADELTGLTFQAITHPEDLDTDLALAARLTRGEIPRYQLGKRYIRKDGTIVDVMLSGSVVRGRDGAPLHYVAQIEDVSDRKRAEAALRRSEEALSRAQRVAHLGSWERDLRTGEVHRSAEVYAIYGIEPGPAWSAPNAFARLLHPEDRERVLAAVADAGRRGGSFSLEYRLIRPDGAERVVRLQGECIAEAGVPVRMIGTVLDITDLEHARREREASIRWLSQVLEQSPVGMILLRGAHGERVEPNRRAKEMIGRPLERVGQHADLLRTPEGEPVATEALPSQRALRGERLGWTEYLLRTGTGELLPVATGASPIVDPEGRIEGAVVAFQDISPVKELERLRAEWSSVIAHDLRQPLSAVSLYANVLAKRTEDPALLPAIDRIATAARRLDRMIQDLLDLSRLDARQLSLSREPLDPEGAVRASVATAALAAPDRRFEVRILAELPRIDADRDRLAQVLDNLLGNAVKYGAAGTPVVVELGADAGEVTISVTNLGQGIAPEELPHLFQRFHRTAEARRSGVKGIGLGLYITRALVEAHGGRIAVESAPGGATTFRVRLPCAAAAATRT